MRKVTIKNLYSSLSSNLERLPFAVTKHGKVIAEVNNPGEGLDSLRVTKPYPKKSLDVGMNQTQGYMGVVRSYSKAQQVGNK